MIASKALLCLAETGCNKFFQILMFAKISCCLLTLVLLNSDIPAFANSVDPNQFASEEANWSGSAPFDIKYVNL